MNLNKNDASLFNSDSFISSYLGSNNYSFSRKSKLFISHKVLDCFNISISILIFILSFLSINSQRKWTDFYSMMNDIRNVNINLIDYISTTEEFYIKEIDQIDAFKKTTSKDIIYLVRKNKPEKINRISKYFLNLRNGIYEGQYQRGNL